MNNMIFFRMRVLLLVIGVIGCSHQRSQTEIDSSTQQQNVMEDLDLDGVSNEIDCAPNDPARWEAKVYAFIDEDGDKYTKTLATPVTACVGDQSHPDHLRLAQKGLDCNDTDATIYQTLSLTAPGEVEELVCVGEKLSIAAPTIVNQLPKETTVLDGQPLIVEVQGSYLSYKWYKNGNKNHIADVRVNSFVPTSGGLYTLVASNGAGSTSTSSYIFIESFISTWIVPAHDKTISLPLVKRYHYDFVIDWGDGTVEGISDFESPKINHLYTLDGQYQIRISGALEAWSFTSSTAESAKKIVSVDDFGNLGWVNLERAFYNCINLKSFYGGTTREAISMKQMFQGSISLSDLDLSSFDTDKVKTMRGMFSSMSSLKSLNISSFDTSEVTDMSYMFDNLRNIEELYLANFNTSKVKYMNSMFRSLDGISDLNLLNFDTSNVRDMNRMFYGASGLTALNLENFVTLEVRDMYGMFAQANNLAVLNISNFVTPKLNNMSSMFNGTSKLLFVDLSSFQTGLVTDMSAMFQYASQIRNLDLSHFDTSQVVDMAAMFFHTSTLATLNVTGWDLTKVKDSKLVMSATSRSQILTCDQPSGLFFGNVCQTSTSQNQN